MTTHYPVQNAAHSPLPLSLSGGMARSKQGEGLGRRVGPVETVRPLTKQQIELTMFACGAGEIKELEIGKLLDK